MFEEALQINDFGDLPRGYVVCLCLVNAAFDYDARLHSNLKWAFGPFCYQILDVVRVPVCLPIYFKHHNCAN